MKETLNIKSDSSMSDPWLAEIDYHRKLNRRYVVAALPCFLFFAFFFSRIRGDYFQGIIFSMLSVNAVVTYTWALRMKDLRHLVLLKQIGTAIAFGLLACSMVTGLLGDDIYIFFPWIFIYPVAVLLMFGERIGILCALAFCVAAVTAIFVIELPAWHESAVRVFKINSAVALLFLLVFALISERARVRMRNNLIKTRNKYKEAEVRQRRTNEELKSEIEMRAHSEKALAQSETRYRALFEESAVSLWEENHSQIKKYLDALPQESADDLENYLKQHPEELSKCIRAIWITAVNRATLNLYGAENLTDMLKNIRRLLPSDLFGFIAERITAMYHDGVFNTQIEAQTISGRKLHLLVSSNIPAGYETSWEKVFTSAYDVTEREAMEKEKQRVERQLHHTLQIQAIASLAGGIAHQFNNALTVIVGNLDLLALNVREQPENKRFIVSLKASVDRISRLTEQLLAYAQGGKYQPRDFPIEALIEDLLQSSEMFREPPMVVTTNFENDVYLSGGDVTQIRMVLEAVLANAVEAMDEGGEVVIETRNHKVNTDPNGTGSALPPGDYAVITIEDHGSGMDEETRRRIFEPFFTTKFVGRGLGMAAAYGIVRNHAGMIEVESAPDKGTRVIIYLPSTTNPEDRSSDGPPKQVA